MAGFNRRIWGWMFFDWASQPYFTLLLTFVFAPYFTSAVVGNGALGQQYWGWMLTVTGLLIAVLAPLLGAAADGTGSRRPWIIAFSAMVAAGSASLWWAAPGGSVYWPLIAFGIGLAGAEFAAIFVNAMLPGLGPSRDTGVISGSGWAFGYLGGIVSLATALLLLAENDAGKTLLGNLPAFGLNPETREGTRSVGPLASIWFLAFMVPFFLWASEEGRTAAGSALSGLIKTLRELPGERSLLAFLGSSMFYRDALNGLFAFGGIYAAGILQWSIVQIGVFGVATLICGALFSWLGGFADRKWGPKLVIGTACVTLIAVCAVIFTTTRTMVMFVPISPGSSLPDAVFLICGCVIGGAGGALQAASRTMMTLQADPERMTEAFGLYAFAGKATSFLAPALVAIFTGITGDQRLGVTPLMLLFIIGLALLHQVRPRRNFS